MKTRRIVKQKTGRQAAKPIRYKALRVDATIESAQHTIERKLKLPPGSVKLVYPNGRKARSDATVGALLRHWRGSSW